MNELLRNKDAITIITVLAAHGFETRFVGGCVRDDLLGRTIGDIDLATTALPEQVIRILSNSNIKTIPTGIDHGTVTAIIDQKPYEITTLRKDVATDGRHAKVEFSNDWQEDAQRRDFTINAISCDATGKLFDYCDGQADIAAKHLHFIGDAAQRIQEDYLRILRFFRFASVLDWDITDQATLKTCTRLAPHLKSLSRERVQSELYKLLSGKNYLRIVTIMKEYGILASLVDNLAIDRLKNTVEAEEKHTIKDAFRRLLALIGWQDIEALEKLIVLSKDNRKRLQDLQKIADNADWKLQKHLYFYGRQAVKDFFFLTQADWNFTVIKDWQNPEFPVKAEDIFDLTNGPGPIVGDYLKRMENYWIDQDFKPMKQELLTFLTSANM
jgi:poly(A) polymerase